MYYNFPPNYISIVPRVIVENGNGQVALIKREDGLDGGTWDAPGGGLEYGETLERCGEREVLEETHIKTKITDFIDYKQLFKTDKGLHVLLLYYKGEYIRGEIQADDGVLDAKWVDKSKVLGMENLRPVFREIWTIYLSKYSR